MSQEEQDPTMDEGPFDPAQGRRETRDEEKADKINLSRQEYDELKRQSEEGEKSYDQYVRTYAELENARKRFSKEKSELAKFANTELILAILPIIDNFDRALGNFKGNDQALVENPVLAGVELIRKQFHTFLDQQGVKSFDSVGEKFDPHRHEALMEVETEDKEEGIIVEEIQKGYYLQDRLIRPAVVKIAKRPKQET